MQRVSIRMGYIIEHMYSSIGNISTVNSVNARLVNYSLHTVFPLFFRVSLQGNKIELPIFAKAHTQFRLLDMLKNTSNPVRRNDIIVHFHTTECNDYLYSKTDALIKSLVEFDSSNNNMYTIARTNKGEVYYGCNGTIFNKDMAPLIFNVIECEIIDSTLVYKKVKSYIHPSVFYSNGTVEKCIANKIIPFVMQNGVRVSPCDSRVVNDISYMDTGAGARTIPELSVVDIFDRFFCRPILPSVAYSDDDINDMLNRNIDDVFNIIGL